MSKSEASQTYYLLLTPYDLQAIPTFHFGRRAWNMSLRLNFFLLLLD